MMNGIKAMIFAAGLGTRLKSLTSDKPKALVEVAGKPLLEHAIYFLKKNGITDIVINVHHFADQIINFLDENQNFGLTIHISDERDALLDTGGGLKKAGQFLSDCKAILLFNVDIISSIDLEAFLQAHLNNNAIATLAVRKRSGSRYLLFDHQMQLTAWKNISTNEIKISRADTLDESEMFSFSGIHFLNPEIFKLITENGKFSIIDMYLRLAKTQTIKAFHDQSELWFDLGKKDELPEAERLIKRYLNEN